MAKALLVSAASFFVILPLDKIEDSLGPRYCTPDPVLLSCARTSCYGCNVTCNSFVAQVFAVFEELDDFSRVLPAHEFALILLQLQVQVSSHFATSEFLQRMCWQGCNHGLGSRSWYFLGACVQQVYRSYYAHVRCLKSCPFGRARSSVLQRSACLTESFISHTW